MLAYLVIREGSKWTDVFRLLPGHTVTIGRAPTNQIVVKDERCSRNHAEVFLTNGHWTVRDLGSRNGTLVGSESVSGDRELEPGDVIKIAHCQMAFVHDLSQAFSDERRFQEEQAEETLAGGEAAKTSEAIPFEEAYDPTMITHRRNQTRFLRPAGKDASISASGQVATQLCRLAFELARQSDMAAVSRKALEGLFDAISIDAGAVLIAGRGLKRQIVDTDLEIVATRSDVEPRYHRLSSFLANTVLREGEAVLARNILDDSTLASRDSQGNIHSTSVICAPIRVEKQVVGLIHLYSTVENRQPNPEDLEFTLAVAENVALALKNLTRQAELAENLSISKDEIHQLRQQLGAESHIVGSSPGLLRVQQEINRAAQSRATVLIRGESGVGKELVARAVHYGGLRKKGPYVCLNCAALSESLLESELFGHERGAFTGATDRKIGKFEAAHQGTILLDEIGEMSPTVQAKFLRVLEGHPFERVGGSEAIRVDVRVIAATNRNLEKEVAEKKFRRDLYFRLRVLEIYVPPLRKRTEDIMDLALHFLDRFNSETGRRLEGFTQEASEMMKRYRWPGNVRELKNVIERAVVLARGDVIDVEDLALSNLATASESGADLPSPRPAFELRSLEEMERDHIAATLRELDWNKSRASQVLGIERSTLDRKLRRYQIKRPAKGA